LVARGSLGFVTMKSLRTLDTISYLALLAFMGYLLAPVLG
jgi:hypothetical protein